MKRALFTLALVAGVALTAQAQELKRTDSDAGGTNVETPADPNAAQISFESEVHDFGTIEYLGNGKADFLFTNTGKSPLIISSAKGSCGCTVPSWPKEPIMKGKTGVINVSYDTKRVGPFTKTVTINSNANTPVKVITIKGKVLSKEETESNTPLDRSDKSGIPLEKTSSK